MGIDARLTVYATSKTQAETACAAAFDRIGALDDIMSDYRQSSELMRLCARAGEAPIPVSSELYRVLSYGKRLWRESDGAFDVSVGPLIRLWRAARKAKALPTPKQIEAARRLVGMQRVVLFPDGKRVKLTAQGMKLDLGGIAKGYAGDEAQKALRKNGITRAMVEMGGDIVVSGPPPGTKGWTIRVPNAGDDHGPKDLLFAHQAISTSGDTEQFVILDGKQYSHVVDPRTGMALTNRVQATVVAKTGLESDPLSTAMTILDSVGRKKLLRGHPKIRMYVRIAGAASTH